MQVIPEDLPAVAARGGVLPGVPAATPRPAPWTMSARTLGRGTPRPRPRNRCLPPFPAEFSFSAQIRSLPFSEIQDGHSETHTSQKHFCERRKIPALPSVCLHEGVGAAQSSDFQ